MRAFIDGCNWVEPSSLNVFASTYSIDTIAATVKNAIDPFKDIAIVAMNDYKEARLVGTVTTPTSSH